jgi:hypothetical protein
VDLIAVLRGVAAEFVDDALHRLDRPLAETDRTHGGQRDHAGRCFRVHFGHDRSHAVAVWMIGQDDRDLARIDPHVGGDLDLVEAVCRKPFGDDRYVAPEPMLHVMGEFEG